MDEYKKQLKDFIALKSVSTDPAYKKDVVATAEWMVELFKNYGFESDLLHTEEANPYVYADYTVSEDAETVLIYGHYDVQPADVAEGWDTDPFEVVEKDGKLFGRGVVDNKGQVLIHIVTIGELIEQGKLKYNVKFIIEGDEETGSTDIAVVLKDNYELFKSVDFMLFSDGTAVADMPTMDFSSRGGLSLTLKYKTADDNVHSGVYGGAIPNAAEEMGKFISKLFTKENAVAIEGFYDDVDPIAEQDLENHTRVPVTNEHIMKLIGVKKMTIPGGYDFLTQTGLRPSLEIVGMKSGHITDGYRTIIPNIAETKFNFRLVTSQKPDSVLKQFERFVKEHTPEYVDYEIVDFEKWNAFRSKDGTPLVNTIKTLLTDVYEVAPISHYRGGSLPMLEGVHDVLGKEIVSVSLGNEDSHIHGVNENFTIELVEKGLEFSKRFFSK